MIVVYALLLLYLLIGVIFWFVGIKVNFGGRQAYKEYLKEVDAPSAAIFYCPIIFICSWPLWFRKGGDDDEEK